jgi:hypothetical protein
VAFIDSYFDSQVNCCHGGHLLKKSVCVLFLLVFTLTAQAGVVLTFDQGGTILNGTALNPAYGDRVSANPDSNGHSYGLISNGFGFTPNVVVDYSATPSQVLTIWNDSYGDLTRVLENEPDENTTLMVTFTADPLIDVLLFGFDLAGWPNADYTISSVRVRDLSTNNLLFSESNVLVQGDFNGPRHTSFDFSGAPLSATSLRIEIQPGLGSASDNIGIDNIHFGQSTPGAPVPEPSTAVTLSAGALLMLLLRCRTRRA